MGFCCILPSILLYAHTPEFQLYGCVTLLSPLLPNLLRMAVMPYFRFSGAAATSKTTRCAHVANIVNSVVAWYAQRVVFHFLALPALVDIVLGRHCPGAGYRYSCEAAAPAA